MERDNWDWSSCWVYIISSGIRQHINLLRSNECNCTVLGDQSWEKLLRLSDADAKKFAQQRVGLKDIEVIRNGGKPIPKSQLKTGDIIAYFVGDNFRHVMFYLGDGKTSDCTSSCKTGVRYNKRMPKNIKVALRYTGK